MSELLTVEDLAVDFVTCYGTNNVVRGVSFQVGRQKIAIVGGSGAGKSMIARSIIRLIPKTAAMKAGKLVFSGIDLISQSERQMRKLRGKRIAMIFQDPKFSLNPIMRVGKQIAEHYRLHYRSSNRVAREKTLEMLEAVHISDPERAFMLFPHELSGGMGQRIMIAMMLITKPDLIIADEPTSALDVMVMRQLLGILDKLVIEHQTGLIFISHDINLVRHFCERILVMYSGRVVEDLLSCDLYKARHPYTKALLSSVQQLERRAEFIEVPVRDSSWINDQVFVSNTH